MTEGVETSSCGTSTQSVSERGLVYSGPWVPPWDQREEGGPKDEGVSGGP